MTCQLCQAPYSITLKKRSLTEILKRLLILLKTHALTIAKDLLVMKIGITIVCAAGFYLYSQHRNKESYALNILSVAFISRITGPEFL